ncbi:MAG: M20/M25/M40 family metallo-hydrolase [Chloroflexi bacterium]|nr:M20/M25/M40 family metallo-hydrolase [Chloroflexota bacterium]
MVKRAVVCLVVLVICLSALPVYPGVLAGSAACDNRDNNTFNKLLECVTLEGVRAHQAAFQAIANANGGERVSGGNGYDASAAYVASRASAAGYIVTQQSFQFFSSRSLGPSALDQVAPAALSYIEGVDFNLATQTDAGNVTAAVTAVDLQLGLGNTSSSGCEAADFAGFPAGNIALIQRGGCTFQLKAENAAAAGAVGVIIFNQGDANTPARRGLFAGTLSAAYSGGIPVVTVSYDRGVEWAGTPGLVMHLFANVFRGLATTSNVFAESRDGDPNNVVIVGAHLDSVPRGPGINDNGSGSAAILEVALQMAKVKPRNKVRFAWWGAEESGLVGSTYYVNSLSQAERDRIALYLNFDMVASPNYVRFVYDGDGSAFGLAGPPGSGAIENLFVNFYASRGLASEPTQISFRSDYAAFFNNGIPFGGLFTGAEGIKTAQQALVYGGTAGIQYDPCYHQPCDTFANNNLEVLDLNADAIAYATLQYAMNTESVNGLKGKGNFKPARSGDEWGGDLVR